MIYTKYFIQELILKFGNCNNNINSNIIFFIYLYLVIINGWLFKMSKIDYILSRPNTRGSVDKPSTFENSWILGNSIPHYYVPFTGTHRVNN